MKKILCLVFVTTITLSISIMFTSCGEKDYTNYKNEEGYAEYISYADKGCKYASYYSIPESMVENEKAKKYYENNVRECGNFLITNYLGGICINGYIGESENENDYDPIVIPETLDGKSVIAIGSIETDKSSILSPIDSLDYWNGDYWPVLCYADTVLPATVKYISEYNAFCAWNITVDENNPYYASENGSLYTKDMKTLLFYSGEDGPHSKISEKAEIFAPSNGLYGAWAETIELGKNIKTIDTNYSYTESEEYTKCPFAIKGYKNTAAEKWAKENKIEFIALD